MLRHMCHFNKRPILYYVINTQQWNAAHTVLFHLHLKYNYNVYVILDNVAFQGNSENNGNV